MVEMVENAELQTVEVESKSPPAKPLWSLLRSSHADFAGTTRVKGPRERRGEERRGEERRGEGRGGGEEAEKEEQAHGLGRAQGNKGSAEQPRSDR
jgi:hypothetical protein